MSRTFLPSVEREYPTFAQVVDLPLPPLLFAKQIVLVTGILFSILPLLAVALKSKALYS